MKNDRPSVQKVCVRAHIPAHKFILTNSFLVSVSFLQSATSPFFLLQIFSKCSVEQVEHVHTDTHTMGHAHTCTLSHGHTRTHSHGLTHRCTHTHSHMVTHTLSHGHIHSHGHAHTQLPTFPTCSHSNSNQQLSQAAVSATPHKWRLMLSG